MSMRPMDDGRRGGLIEQIITGLLGRGPRPLPGRPDPNAAVPTRGGGVPPGAVAPRVSSAQVPTRSDLTPEQQMMVQKIMQQNAGGLSGHMGGGAPAAPAGGPPLPRMRPPAQALPGGGAGSFQARTGVAPDSVDPLAPIMAALEAGKRGLGGVGQAVAETPGMIQETLESLFGGGESHPPAAKPDTNYSSNWGVYGGPADGGPIPEEKISGDSVYDPESDSFSKPPNTATGVPVEVVDVDPGSVKHDAEMAAGTDKGGTAAVKGGGKTTHTVTQGDTLWAIAEGIVGSDNPQMIKQTVDAIARMNGLKDANRINKGQVLKLPGQNVAMPRSRGAGVDSDEEYG